MKITYSKIKRRTWREIIVRAKKTNFYYYLYKSYWNYLFNSKSDISNNSNIYFTARPNPGAGIGHQISNWNAGYWFAMKFGLRYAHSPFPSDLWENSLNFGFNEITVEELVTKYKYKKVLLPLFDEYKECETNLIKDIINSYSNQKIVFIAEQDQLYEKQYEIIDVIQNKFYKSKYRSEDKLIFNQDDFNITIHIRRGDIMLGQKNKNPGLLKRVQKDEYFINVLSNTLKLFKEKKNIAIFIFSQGIENDFENYKKFPNVRFCLDMNGYDSFIHMVYSDVIITSKSSFSYKPALLNKGIKICPANFWHSYPSTKDWLTADENGKILNA